MRKIPIPIDVPLTYRVEDEHGFVVEKKPNQKYPSGPYFLFLLGFVKWGSKGWRICWCVNYDNHPEDDFDWTPITECSLDVRLNVWEHIDELREAVENAAERCVPNLNAAVAAFRTKLANWKK